MPRAALLTRGSLLFAGSPSARASAGGATPSADTSANTTAAYSSDSDNSGCSRHP